MDYFSVLSIPPDLYPKEGLNNLHLDETSDSSSQRTQHLIDLFFNCAPGKQIEALSNSPRYNVFLSRQVNKNPTSRLKMLNLISSLLWKTNKTTFSFWQINNINSEDRALLSLLQDAADELSQIKNSSEETSFEKIKEIFLHLIEIGDFNGVHQLFLSLGATFDSTSGKPSKEKLKYLKVILDAYITQVESY